MPKRQFQDEGVVRTDEQQDPTTRYNEEKVFDAAHPEVQGDPRDTQEPGQPHTVFHHTETTRTDEQEQPQQSVRDSYSDS